MSNKKEKSWYQKIRKTWEINPKERIKENKLKKDLCDECGNYLNNPGVCLDCYGINDD